MILTKNWQELFRFYITISSNRNVPFIVYGKLNKQYTEENYSLVDLKMDSYEVEYSSYAFADNCSSTLDGTYQSLGTYYFGTKTVQTKQIKILHEEDGTASREVAAIFNGAAYGTNSGRGSFTLPTIERYATFTSHAIESVTQNNIQVKWSADSEISAIQYSIDGGGWIGTSLTSPYSITGLKSGTTYSIKTRIKRKDSGLWTESQALSATTKKYALKVKVNGVWKEAVPYIKVNGQWKSIVPYIKVNGVWKKGA